MNLKKKLSLSILIIIMALSPCLAATAGGSGESMQSKYSQVQTSKLQSIDALNKYKTDRFIIKYKNEDGRAELSNALKGQYKQKKQLKNAKLDLLMLNSKTDMANLYSSLKQKNADKNIEYIQPDYSMSMSSEDTNLEMQWGIHNKNTVDATLSTDRTQSFRYLPDANAEAAWEVSEGEGIVVAVLDTGIDITHEDLAKNIWSNPGEIQGNGIDDDGNGYIDDINGWNFYDNTNEVHNGVSSQDEWHGTHIAGTIAAERNNGKGIAGVAPKARIMPLKIFSQGTAYTSSIIEAIEYASQMGAKIINCSFGSSEGNPALKEAIEQTNGLFVCAAGNGGADIKTNPIYPAAFELDNVLAVAAINEVGQLAQFSNYGEQRVAIAAPGENILSTFPDNSYGISSGTSMAAAFVSGEAALILSRENELSISKVKNRIIYSSERLSTLLNKVFRGNKINCSNAVNGYTSDENEILYLKDGQSEGNKDWLLDGNIGNTGEYQTLSTQNLLSGTTAIGPFLSPSYNSGASIIDIIHPKTGSTVKAIRLNGGAALPQVKAQTALSLKAKTVYVLEFDYWADADNVAFDVDLYPDDLPQCYPTAQKVMQHYRWEIYSSSANMGSAWLRVFNDITNPNPANIYITNIKLTEGSLEYQYDQNNRLIYIYKGDKPVFNFNYDSNGRMTRKQFVFQVPENLLVTSGNESSISVNWSGVYGSTGYKIYKNGQYAGTTASTSYSFTGLLPNTQYTLEVAPYNSSKEGAKAAVTAKTAPTVPTGLASSNITDKAANLSWTAVSGATKYYVSLNSIANVVGESSTNSFGLTNLSADTPYTVYVRAYNGSLSSSPASISIRTIATLTVTAPQLLSSYTAIDDISAYIQWSSVTNAKGYKLYKNGQLVTTTTGAGYKYTGLTANTQYTLEVSAYNDTSESAKTALIIKTAPNAPTNLSSEMVCVSNIDGWTVTLSWTASVGAQKYSIYKIRETFSNITDTTRKFIAYSTQTSYSVNRLSGVITITYEVKSYNGNYSRPVTIVVTVPTVPNDPL